MRRRTVLLLAAPLPLWAAPKGNMKQLLIAGAAVCAVASATSLWSWLCYRRETDAVRTMAKIVMIVSLVLGVLPMLVVPVLVPTVLFWTVLWAVAGGLVMDKFENVPPGKAMGGWLVMTMAGVGLVWLLDPPTFAKVFAL